MPEAQDFGLDREALHRLTSLRRHRDFVLLILTHVYSVLSVTPPFGPERLTAEGW